MSEEQAMPKDGEAAFEWLMRRYGDRLTPEMAEGLRGAVETVVKTVAAVRAVPLANDEAPLTGFAPVRKEG